MELTDKQGWSRIHGAVIGGVDSRELIADLLHERNILAEIQWFLTTDLQVSMVLAERNGRVATLDWDGDTAQELEEGPLISDLVEELAGILDAEVRIGSFVADHLPVKPATPEVEPAPEGENTTDQGEESPEGISTVEDLGRHLEGDVFPKSVRMVEISRTSEDLFPAFAALQREPVGCAELQGGQRALFASVPNSRKGWGYGELPTVTLVRDMEGITIILVTDDHIEHMSAFDWTMHRQLISGSRMDISAGQLPDNLADLVTKRQDLLRIANAVEGANAHLFALAALEAAHREDWQVAAAALGLPTSVVDYLNGVAELHSLDGVTVHEPIRVTKAITRTVDKKLGEVTEKQPEFAAQYKRVIKEHPGMVRGLIAAEAVLGLSLLVASRKFTKATPRKKKILGWSGALLALDSVCQYGVMRYLKQE